MPKRSFLEWFVPGLYWKREARSLELARQAAMRLMEQRRVQHEEDIAHERKRIDQLLAAASSIRWEQKEAGCYAVTVTMDPRLFGLMPGDKYGQECLAHHVARDIEKHITTGHFVQMSHEERERMMRSMGPSLSDWKP